MRIEEITGFVPIERDDGTEFMAPTKIGIRFLMDDSVQYGEEWGEPTTFVYTYRTKTLTHKPSMVAETDKYGRPKRIFANGKISWAKRREIGGITVEQLLRDYSYKFCEPILMAIAEAEENREATREFAQFRRDCQVHKQKQRDEQSKASNLAVADLLKDLLA